MKTQLEKYEMFIIKRDENNAVKMFYYNDNIELQTPKGGEITEKNFVDIFSGFEFLMNNKKIDMIPKDNDTIYYFLRNANEKNNAYIFVAEESSIVKVKVTNEAAFNLYKAMLGDVPMSTPLIKIITKNK